ncbi:MAG: glutamate 5-kinase [Pseudomonadales bacterium]|nr:glutamate 5-kinase [Pseudomonadales bacterium]
MSGLDNAWGRVSQAKRWVVKIGSALLTADGAGLDQAAIAAWVDQISALRKQGIDIVLVSSGSIAEGMSRLNMRQRPHELHRLQAAAAVGQMGLIQAYESNFQRYQTHTAQILLTHDDLSNRQRYLNARSTIKELLKLGAVPVINENDTVVTDEIRFGDNDSLGALVANLVEADLLIILTDQMGLHQSDPRQNPEAPIISQAFASDRTLDEMVSGGMGRVGRGGMSTKLNAARLASRSGTGTLITSGRQQQVLERLHQGEQLGTLLIPDLEPLVARKRWLAGHLQARGRIVLDQGAVDVLIGQGRSLLPVGVKAVYGDFSRGDMVTCEGLDGNAIARGLINYDAEDSRKIMGKPSGQIEAILGYVSEPELIHRDNLVLL